MLSDGFVSPLRSGKTPDNDDGAALATITGIPRFVWELLWLALAGWCAWQTAIRLWP